jgi:hypothetical protein
MLTFGAAYLMHKSLDCAVARHNGTRRTAIWHD